MDFSCFQIFRAAYAIQNCAILWAHVLHANSEVVYTAWKIQMQLKSAFTPPSASNRDVNIIIGLTFKHRCSETAKLYYKFCGVFLCHYLSFSFHCFLIWYYLTGSLQNIANWDRESKTAVKSCVQTQKLMPAAMFSAFFSWINSNLSSPAWLPMSSRLHWFFSKYCIGSLWG